MRVLVTGGTGFVGSHTVIELLLSGHEVEIFDNLSNSRSSVVERVGEITGIQPSLHIGDIRDRRTVVSVLDAGDFDAIFHFAGLKAVGESVERPLEYYESNVVGSAVLLRAASQLGIHRFIFSSSCTVYGEPDTAPVSEESPRKAATNPYGRTKQVIEDMLFDVAAADTRWAVGILRYFNPVGAHPSGLIGEDPCGGPNNLLPYVSQVAAKVLPELKVFGQDYPTRDGTGIRDYVHVVDLARGHCAALDFLANRDGVYVWNLGTGSGTTVLELVEIFEQANGVPVPYRVVERRPGDIAATWADPAKANRELGWIAERDLGDICRDAWRWQLAQSNANPR